MHEVDLDKDKDKNIISLNSAFVTVLDDFHHRILSMVRYLIRR